MELDTIPAWVVSLEDYERLLGNRFDGECPHRLADLRDYIRCGEQTAEEVGQ